MHSRQCPNSKWCVQNYTKTLILWSGGTFLPIFRVYSQSQTVSFRVVYKSFFNLPLFEVQTKKFNVKLKRSRSSQSQGIIFTVVYCTFFKLSLFEGKTGYFNVKQKKQWRSIENSRLLNKWFDILMYICLWNKI